MGRGKAAMASFIRKWDLYKKVPEEFYQSTYSGVCLSLVGIAIMTLLFALEFSSFLEVKTRTDIVLDQGDSERSGMLAINFNISMMDLPCQFASVDVSDITGTRKHDIHQNIQKWRLDSKGRRLGLLEEHAIEPEEHEDVEHRELAELEALLAENLDDEAHAEKLTMDTFENYLTSNSDKLVLVNFFAPWCIWCRRLEPVWENTAKKIMGSHHTIKSPILLASVDCTAQPELCMKHYVRAYPTIYFFLHGETKPREAYHGERTTTAIVTRAHKVLAGEQTLADKTKHALNKADGGGDIGHEGCMVAGRLMVKRVPGNFHMYLHSPRYSAHNELVNASHIVHRLNFGDPLSERQVRRMKALPASARKEMSVDKLDTQNFVAHHKNYTFVHYLKVVSKKFITGDPEINTYRYSAYSNEHKEDEEVPSIMFQYDLSPMTVVTTFESQPFYHFITNFCAIIGGVFSIIGIIDRLLQTVLGGLTKKIL